MRTIEKLVDAFILTVGITPPGPSLRHKATVFIAAGLVGTAAGVVGLLLFALWHSPGNR